MKLNYIFAALLCLLVLSASNNPFGAGLWELIGSTLTYNGGNLDVGGDIYLGVKSTGDHDVGLFFYDDGLYTTRIRFDDGTTSYKLDVRGNGVAQFAETYGYFRTLKPYANGVYDIGASGEIFDDIYSNNINSIDGTTTIDSLLNLTPCEAPGSPAEGDVYTNDTDHHLYFYNGSGWVQLDN